MDGLVSVFGGSGFIGRQTVRALAKRGHRIRVAVRNPGGAYRLRMLGDVGQVQIVQANLRNPASIARALDGAQACVNLVGVLYETGRQAFQSVHAMGSRNVAEAAAAQGITSFVQMSALGADPDSASKYARTKAMGEAAVREVMPTATILRPSVVFGAEDAFLNKFAAMATLSPGLPLVGGGQTRFQPVFVADVAAAIAAALTDPAAMGRAYELGGPGIYTFKQLMELVLRETGRKRLLLPLPFPLATLIGTLSQFSAPLFPPVLTADQVELLRHDNVVTPGAPGLAELGIEATAVEPVVATYLYRYRKGGQYADQVVRA